MDASIVTALAALTGSLVGGLTTFASTWLSQRYQDARERNAVEVGKREALYGEFINESTRVAVDAIERDIESLSALVQLFALHNRIRLTASDEVLDAADKVIDQIAELYMGANKTPREIFDEVKNSASGRPDDPLRDFGVACRRELQNWRSR